MLVGSGRGVVGILKGRTRDALQVGERSLVEVTASIFRPLKRLHRTRGYQRFSTSPFDGRWEIGPSRPPQALRRHKPRLGACGALPRGLRAPGSFCFQTGVQTRSHQHGKHEYRCSHSSCERARHQRSRIQHCIEHARRGCRHPASSRAQCAPTVTRAADAAPCVPLTNMPSPPLWYSTATL